MRRRVALTAAVVACAFLFPAVAFGHGLVGRSDLPIPEWLFGWAAAVVLVASFAALAVLWRTPRLEQSPTRRLMRIPRVVETVGGVVGVLAFAGVVYAGFAGEQTPTSNVAPTVVYVLFWVGIPVLSAVLGNVFRAFSPWRAIGRTAGIDYGVVSATAIWYVQVGALVAGHVAALVLAHDRALADFRATQRAVRSQYWMLAVMVGFTTLGLWLLSEANG
jgi:hypothetical protein